MTINIISRIPNDLTSLWGQFVKGKEIANQVLNAAIIIAIILGIVVLVIFLQGGIRKIPVQYSRKYRQKTGGRSDDTHPAED